jgi:ribosomal protein S18 acetylase RimI-like enzyme
VSVSPALGQTPGRVDQPSDSRHERRPALVHVALTPGPRTAISIPARAHACPGDGATAQLVILDSSLVPTTAHFEHWASELAARGFTRMRTGALAPRHALQAESAGLRCIQDLALLEANPPFAIPDATQRTTRSRASHVDDLAAVDHAAFGDVWRLDAAMLRDVRTATPSSRARVVKTSALARSVEAPVAGTVTGVAGFLLAGRAGRNGYIQRLAVDPATRRHGVATSLLADATRWLRRWKVERIFVNTHVDNDPALALYRAHGFHDLPERLRVFEGATRR